MQVPEFQAKVDGADLNVIQQAPAMIAFQLYSAC